ncbi:MAG TPA: RtcB family protein, partial [Candidatus Nitrosotenuis sp.]|nr:RtcB family protein [Candidatus Nitrosotenuis sp.]
EGVISPGGVGFDINCGVRLVATNLDYNTVRPRLEDLVEAIFHSVPAGVGAHGAIPRLSRGDFLKLITRGVRWAIEQGYGHQDDLEYIEEGGCLAGADPEAVSERAIERGIGQVGTLGSGNHFLEVQKVDHIHDPALAEGLGLFPGQVVFTIHSGSRGFGYQICDDYLKKMQPAMRRYSIVLPDRQLACAPLSSEEGRAYLAAMKCAANYAWVNRQVMMHLAEQAFLKVFKIGPRDLGRRLIYDVCHNIAKFEEYPVEGRPTTVCVHRKGATRAMPPGHPLTPRAYQKVGQPVLIPGDMGRYSYVLVGTEKAVQTSFGSSCHGAGRLLSRTAAKKKVRGRELVAELAQKGIIVRARGMATVEEEAPLAYKDVSEVVAVMERTGLSRIVARLRPVGVVKG